MKSLLLLLSLFAVDSTAVLGREDIISAVMSSTYKNRAASNCIDGERTTERTRRTSCCPRGES